MKEYEPLNDMKKHFKVDWYRSHLDKSQLHELTQKSDLKGLIQSVGYLALISLTFSFAHLLFLRGEWVLFVFAACLHGTVYCFNYAQVGHELSHGTVFRTKALNWIFLRVFALLSMFNFHHYKRSHTYHHLYTLHPQGDREVVLPRKPSLSFFWLLMMFTVNFPRLWMVMVRGMIVPVFTGKIIERGEWSHAIYSEDDKVGRRKAVTWMRIVFLFHIAIGVFGAVSGYWHLTILLTFGNFIGYWWRYFIGTTMHVGLRDNVEDFRKCCRSIRLDPFSEFLYWRMNYHTEHHMYAAVPCYNLPLLSKVISWDMPVRRTLLQAWKEMRATWIKQQSDPTYQFDTPVPDAQKNKTVGGEGDASLGDLAPKEFLV